MNGFSGSAGGSAGGAAHFDECPFRPVDAVEIVGGGGGPNGERSTTYRLKDGSFKTVNWSVGGTGRSEGEK